MPDEQTYPKIAVIGGAGAVGATSAYALLISGLASEIVLVDSNARRAEGEALDLAQGTPFVRPVTVRSGSYADCAGAQVIVLTAGAARKSGESRLDLLKRNVEIFREVIPQVAAAAPESILLVIANPVDALTYVAWKLSGFPAGRVLGSGTVLDTARLRALIGQRLAVDPRSVHAYVIGEHGDSEVIVWSRAAVAGMSIDEFCAQRGGNCGRDIQAEIAHQVRYAGHEIIQRKGATYYAIGLGVRHIVESILRDQNTILTLSTLLTGQLGVEDICLSLPTVVDRGGVEAVLAPVLSEEEAIAFERSAQVVGDITRAAGLS